MRTLRVGNNAIVQTGRVQIQPSNDHNDNALSENDKNYSSLSLESTPLSVGQLNYNVTNNAFVSIQTSNVAAMVRDTLADGTVMTSLKGTSGCSISPVSTKVATKDDLKDVLDFTSTSKQVQPYEALTGISTERPEIVMITEFSPLFKASIPTDNQHKARYTDDDVHALMTDVGQYFDVQLDLRLIKSNNMSQLILHNKGRSNRFSLALSKQLSDSTSSVQTLHVSAKYLSSVIQTLEKLKQQLDIRAKAYTVDPQAILRDYVADYTLTTSPQLIANATEAMTTNFSNRYDILDMLQMFDFGVTNIGYAFSSTKLWLQTLLELKTSLETHTLALFDIKSNQSKLDASAVKLTFNADVKRFSFNVPNLSANALSIDVMKNAKQNDIVQLCTQLANTYDILYKNAQFRSNEMKVAGLVNAISREYRYSRGLSLQSVQQTLLKNFQYQVADTNNLNVFSSIIGDVGRTIDDVSYTQSNTLIAVAQQKIGDLIVLPLESKYIEGSFGTLTPGSAYIVDSVLDTDGKTYNTGNMQRYVALLANLKQSFNTIASGMNLASCDIEKFTNAHSLSTMSLNNSNTLFTWLSQKYVTSLGAPTQLVKNDVTTALFAMANGDSRLKSMLMLLLLLKVTKARGNTVPFIQGNIFSDSNSTITYLIESIMSRMVSIAKSLKLHHTSHVHLQGLSVDSSTISTLVNVDEIRSALTANCELMQSVEDTLSKILTTFRDDNAALNGSRTRYSGMQDSVLLLTVFDVITSMIDMCGNCHVVGMQSNTFQDSFVVQRKYDDHSASLKEIISRVNGEVVTTQHAIFFVMNTLNRLHNAMTNVINFLNGNSSLIQLKSIMSILDNDATMLRYALSDQQVKLFANTVADILSESSVESEKALTIYDDATMTQETRDAFNAVMMSPQFTSAYGSDYRILTVGVPLGFAHHLQQKVNLSDAKKSSFDDQQNDVICINVYKVDLENPDIVYRPLKFMFELSRFPARGKTFIKTNDTFGKGLFESIRRFATRDGDQVFSEGGTAVQYIRSQKGEIEAFNGSSYSFLSQRTKDDIYTNHVLSYLLGIYVKVMTGLSTADADFDMLPNQKLIDSKFIDALLNSDINRIATTTTSTKASGSIMNHGSFFGLLNDGESSTTKTLSTYSSDLVSSVISSGQNDTDAASVLSSIHKKDAGVLISDIITINELAWLQSSLSSPTLYAKKIMRPKQFDRVFNIPVDRYAFEVDVEQTFSTPLGKQAFQLLLDAGEMLPLKTQMTSMNNVINTNTFVRRRQSISDGDVGLEKYIVTIETVGETEV